MAQGKKSFVLYCDLIHTVDKLPDDKAGQLFKHILAYVNDLNPLTDDLIVNIAFEPIKQQLKRDLQKWETEIKPKRSEAGRLGGLKSGEARRSKTKQNEANASNSKQNEANEAVNVNVSVNDNVINRLGKPKPRKITFEDCDLFDKQKFAETFKGWPKEKLRHYYDAATRYSIEGNKYVSWQLAIQTWERKDAAKGMTYVPIIEEMTQAEINKQKERDFYARL